MCTLYVQVAACITSFLCFILSVFPERKFCCCAPRLYPFPLHGDVPSLLLRWGRGKHLVAAGCHGRTVNLGFTQSGHCPALGQVTSALSHHFFTVSRNHGFLWALQEPGMKGRAVPGTLVCGARYEEIHCLTLRFGRIVFQVNTGSWLIGWPR